MDWQSWGNFTKLFAIAMIAIAAWSVASFVFEAVRNKQVRVKELFERSIFLVMFAVFFSGIFLYPDAPIRQCDNALGYCGKGGQPHTLADYSNFELWQTTLFVIWPLGMATLLLLRFKERFVAKWRAPTDARFTAWRRLPWSPWRTLYPNNPAEFRSDYDLTTSVERLRDATSPHLFASMLKQRAVGTVKAGYVGLQRVIPGFGNSFKPIFVGKFQQEPQGVVLRGRFTTFGFAKAFMTVWFGGLLFGFVLAVRQAALAILAEPHLTTTNAELVLMPAGVVAFAGVGYFFLRFCWWLSRGDVDYLAKLISNTLSISVTAER